MKWYQKVIEALIKEKGMTATSIAERIGVGQTSISLYKKGGAVPSADVATALFALLHGPDMAKAFLDCDIYSAADAELIAENRRLRAESERLMRALLYVARTAESAASPGPLIIDAAPMAADHNGKPEVLPLVEVGDENDVPPPPPPPPPPDPKPKKKRGRKKK